MIRAARTSCRKASGDLKSNISQGWSLHRSCRHLWQPRKSCRWPPTFGDPSGKATGSDALHLTHPPEYNRFWWPRLKDKQGWHPGAASHGLRKVGAEISKSSCYQKINIGKEPPGWENVRQLVNQKVTADKGKLLATSYRGFFSPTTRNSGFPTFTRRRLLQSILHAPPGR